MFLFDEKRALGKKFRIDSPSVNKDMFTLITSWKTHYNSWKNFKKNYLLIKYENLISHPDKEFRKISDYVSHKNGGHGCVREIVEQVLKVQGKWIFEN